MIGFRVGTEFLDLNPGTAIQFVLNSPIYYGSGDHEIFQGSYSIPVTLPLSIKNKRIFNQAQAIDAMDITRKIEEVHFYASGIYLYTGTLYLLRSGTSGFRTSIVLNDVHDFKSLALNEIELGEFIEGAMKIHAANTITVPHSFNHSFFSVKNPLFVDAENLPSDDAYHEYQNAYQYTVDGFVDESDYAGVTPFLSLRFLLEKAVEAMGLTLINNFQTDDELNSLFVYNNKSIHLPGFPWNYIIRYTDHAPEIDIVSFVREIARLFYLAVIPDTKNKTLELYPLRDLAEAAISRNWTAYASYEHDIEETDIFKRMKFEHDESIGYPVINSEIDIDGTVNEPASLFAQPPGTYYLVATDNYYIWDTYPTLIHQKFDSIETDGTLDEVFVLPAMYMSKDTFSIGGVSFAYAGEYLYINQAGTIDFVQVLGAETEGDYSQKNEFPLQLFFGRGWEEHPSTVLGSGIEFPYANTHPYNPRSDLTYNYSLRLTGERGIEEVWASSWINLLQRSRTVFRTLNLPLAQLSGFSFKEKVRIENNHYLVKQLKVTFTSDGLLPIEATLITTL